MNYKIKVSCRRKEDLSRLHSEVKHLFEDGTRTDVTGSSWVGELAEDHFCMEIDSTLYIPMIHPLWADDQDVVEKDSEEIPCNYVIELDARGTNNQFSQFDIANMMYHRLVGIKDYIGTDIVLNDGATPENGKPDPILLLFSPVSKWRPFIGIESLEIYNLNYDQKEKELAESPTPDISEDEPAKG